MQTGGQTRNYHCAFIL